jgi:hypothetical protein
MGNRPMWHPTCLFFEHWHWAPGGQGLTATPGWLSMGLCTASVDGRRRVVLDGNVQQQRQAGTASRMAMTDARLTP